MNTETHTNAAFDFSEGMPNAKTAFADFYRKMVEEGLRSEKEKPLIPHANVMAMLDATIARREKKSA